MQDAEPPSSEQSVAVSLVGVVKGDFVRLRAQPTIHSPEQGPAPTFNTTLYIDQRLARAGWYHATTPDGRAGYVASDYVDVIPFRDPGAKLYAVRPAETASDIAQASYHDTKDYRFYVNVLAYANDPALLGHATALYRTPPDSQDWSAVNFHHGSPDAPVYVWIPSREFAEALRNTAPDGSLTHGAWSTVAHAWSGAEQAAAGLFRFEAASAIFDAGLAAGVVMMVWDTLVGVVTAVPLVLQLLKGLIFDHLIAKAQDLWKALSQVQWGQALGALAGIFMADWDNPDFIKRWFFRGQIIGEAVAFLLLTFFSGGIAAALKGVSLVGKVADAIKGIEAVSALLKGAAVLRGTAAAQAIAHGYTLYRDLDVVLTVGVVSKLRKASLSLATIEGLSKSVNVAALKRLVDSLARRDVAALEQVGELQGFAGDARTVVAEWDSLKTPEKRLEALTMAINDRLAVVNVATIRRVQAADIGTNLGRFDLGSWNILLSRKLLSQPTLTAQQATELAWVLYHEARHAEQWFMMACMLAGRGQTAQEIRGGMRLLRDIADQAARDPLKSDSIEAVEAMGWYTSVYGSGRAARQALLAQRPPQRRGTRSARQRLKSYWQHHQPVRRDASVGGCKGTMGARRHAEGPNYSQRRDG